MLQKLLLWNFCLWGGICFAQPSIQWAKAYGGTKSDLIEDIAATPGGKYLITGGASSFDGDAFGNHGSADVFTICLNDNGDILWKKMFGGTDFDWGAKVISTPDGGGIIAGYSGSNSGNVSGNHGDFDVWLVKIDNIGNIQWQKSYGGSKKDIATCIRPTADNGFVFTGYSESEDGDLTLNHGFYDYWVVKISNLGVIEWQKSYGGSSDDRANSVLQTEDGGFLVYGTTLSDNGNVAMNHGASDAWLIKLDSLGVIEWQKCFGGPGIDSGAEIANAEKGAFFMLSQSFSNGGDVSGHHGLSDIWLLKTDEKGKIIWEKCFGGSDDDYPGGLDVSTNGNVMITSESSSVDGDVSGNMGGSDLWLLCLDINGNPQWNQNYGGSRSESGVAILETVNKGIIMVGSANSIDGDVSGVHGDKPDYWIIKLSPNSTTTTSLTLRTINLSPNPASTSISLYPPRQDIDYQGEVSDASGQVLLRKKLKASSGPAELDISTLPPGIYFIQLMDAEGKIFSGRIFKE